MGGGHHDNRNHNNMQESDEDMQGKIQRIEMIKHMPNHWHMTFWNMRNMWTVLGDMGTAAYAAVGTSIAVLYFKNGAAHVTPNFYAYNLRLWGRIAMGMTFGIAAGYMQFGDRQRLHNAWVAERLRRRYPDCMSLKTGDLWQLKGVKADHSYYKWT